MNRRRRWVWWIVGIVLVAVIAGGALVLLSASRYQLTVTPDAAAYNYQTALVNEDFGRAYGTLSPALAGYPATADIFARDLEVYSNLPPSDIDVCMYVESTVRAGDIATVTIREQWYDTCLPLVEMRNLSFNQIVMQVRREDGVWRVVSADHHFADCWNAAGGCP